jgi:hypothetical protein
LRIARSVFLLAEGCALVKIKKQVLPLCGRMTGRKTKTNANANAKAGPPALRKDDN